MVVYLAQTRRNHVTLPLTPSSNSSSSRSSIGYLPMATVMTSVLASPHTYTMSSTRRCGIGARDSRRQGTRGR